MDIPFSDGVATYRWRCSACGATTERSRGFNFGDQIWKPGLPEDWVSVGADLFCPKHKVKLMVDGDVIVWRR